MRSRGPSLILPATRAVVEPRGDLAALVGRYRVTLGGEGAWARCFEWIDEEIPRRYPDSEMVARDIEMALDGDLSSFSPTSRRKAMLVAWDGFQVVGATVLTLKARGHVKFGPTVVPATERNRGVARALRLAGEHYARAQGASAAYSTCDAANSAGRAYVEACGYRLVANLVAHYSPGRIECVYFKPLRPMWAGYNEGAPLAVTASRKRGGAMALPIRALLDSGMTTAALEARLAESTLSDARRIFVTAPRSATLEALVRPLGFVWEGIDPAHGAYALNRE